MEKTAKQKEEEAEINKRLKAISTAIGAPGVSLTTLKLKPKQVQDMWETASRSQSAGPSFKDAMLLISDQGSIPGMRKLGRAEFANLQEAFQERLKNDSHKLTVDWKSLYPMSTRPPTQKEIFDVAAEQLENSIYAETRANMLAASPINPYKISHTYTVKDWRGNPNNPVFKWVSAQIDKNVKINDAILFDAIQRQVAAGQVLPAVAAQAISEYYNTAIERNNRVRDFEFIGLKKQEDYNILPPGSKSIINLTDRTQLERVLTVQASKSFAETLIRAAPFGPAAITTGEVGGKAIGEAVLAVKKKLGVGGGGEQVFPAEEK